MHISRTAVAVAATSLSLSCALAQMQGFDPNAKAGYFVTNFTAEDQYVFAINAVQNGDIYWHMSAPTTNQWVGVGIGDNMAGALMLISYKSANGTGVTTSARMATGNSEPEVVRDLNVEKIWTDLYAPFCNTARHGAGGIMISHGVCRGCGNVSSLDYASTAQPFIFAIGPKDSLNEDSLDAPLKRHIYYGRFTMDMTLATTPLDFSEGADYGRVPAPNLGGDSIVQDNNGFVSAGSSLPMDTHTDSDPQPIAHGVMMGLAFIVVFPLGSLLLRLTSSVRWHWAVQSFGMLLVLVGFGAGVFISYEYNRGKSFRSAHQVIGLLIFAGVLIQFGLGLTHHLIFKRTKQPTSFRKVHLVLGPAIILLAIINGGLGINLAHDGFARVPYAIAVLVLSFLFVAARVYLHIFHNAVPYRPDEETLEHYRHTNSFGVGAPQSPLNRKGYEGIVVPVPEAYHEGQTPASAVSAGRQFAWDNMSTPVTVAPPTPRWPVPGLGRTYSSASVASRSTTFTEREAFGKGNEHGAGEVFEADILGIAEGNNLSSPVLCHANYLPVIIDFGAARLGPPGQKYLGDVRPGVFRAPEVVAGIRWDSQIADWSLGVMIWNLLEDGNLFSPVKCGHLDDELHFAQMVSLMGRRPKQFLERSDRCRKYWDPEGNWIAARPIPKQTLKTREMRLEGRDRDLLLALVRKTLRWLPEDRPTAEDLYKDEFIAPSINNGWSHLPYRSSYTSSRRSCLRAQAL